MKSKNPFEDWIKSDDNKHLIDLELLKGDDKISEEEYNRLKEMNSSPDKENAEVVKIIIEVKNEDDKTKTSTTRD